MTDSPGSSGPRIARGVMLLGFAGLLPQIAALLMILSGRGFAGVLIALAYALLILSFLGGIWWGFAMRRATDQVPLAAIAVVPSLVAMAIAMVVAVTGSIGFALVATGVAILVTLPVDHHLVRTGDASADWMRLRIPLSSGLGGLTILAGLCVHGPHALF